MPSTLQLVVFTLDDRYYALHLAAVERIVPAVEVTPLTNAPEIVPGVVNVAGRILPVVDIRRRFQLPEREIALGDHMVIAQTSRREVVLIADAVTGVIERGAKEMTAAQGIIPGLEYLQGVVKFEDGLILIHDLETFLSLEEEKALEKAMAPA